MSPALPVLPTKKRLDWPMNAYAPSRLLISSVSVGYLGFEVLRRVSLLVEPSTVHALVGPNGSGKTTLLNVVSGLVVPWEGSVWLGETSIGEMHVSERRWHGLARSFQAPHLMPKLTVREHLSLSARRRSIFDALFRRPGDIRSGLTASEWILDGLGLTKDLDAEAATLSHGTKKMLDLACAIASQPRTLLLDEPSSGLDDRAIGRMVDVVAAVARFASVLIVEHNFDVIRALSARVSYLYQGGITMTGTIDEVVGADVARTSYHGGEQE